MFPVSQIKDLGIACDAASCMMVLFVSVTTSHCRVFFPDFYSALLLAHPPQNEVPTEAFALASILRWPLHIQLP